MAQVLWVVCANDFPDGVAFTTEAAAQAYCDVRNHINRTARLTGRERTPVRWHCHRVEVRS